MLIKTWRFITIILTALLMGMTFCHVLEMPAKMKYAASFYLTIHRSLYVAFGAPNIGAWIEIGAILAAIVLVFLLRGQRRAFRMTLISALCLIAGLAIYFVFIEPANAAMRAMMIDVPPDSFLGWRNQWEYGHAAHFILHLLGFSALVLSVLPAVDYSLPQARARP
jgi:hypothetical protein